MLETNLKFYNEFSPVSPFLNGQEKSGHLWDFTKVYRNHNGGYLYNFVLKPEYNSLAKFYYNESGEFQPMTQEKYRTISNNTKRKNDQIFPAIEQTWTNLIFLKDRITSTEYTTVMASTILKFDSNQNTDINTKISFHEKYFNTSFLPILPDLHTLGYSLNYDANRMNVVVTLPDRDALLLNWKVLQQKYPDLPDLYIEPAEGSASDTDFLDSFMKGYFVLSENQEFIHDHTTHLLRYTVYLLQEAKGLRYPKTQKMIDIMKVKISVEFENILFAARYLPLDQKNKFAPLIHILAQQADITLGFGKAVTQHFEDFDVRDPKNFNLEILNQSLKTQFSHDDMSNLWKEVDRILISL